MKQCESNSERLSALADGELGFVSAWRLKRHLASCPQCTAEFESCQRVNITLRSADMYDGAQEMARETRQRERRLTLARVAAAGAIAAAGIAGGIFNATPIRPLSAGAAQAAVDEAMSRVRFAEWNEVFYTYDDRGTQRIFEQSEFRARTSPATVLQVRRTYWPGKPTIVTYFRRDAREETVFSEESVSSPVGHVTIYRKFRLDLPNAFGGSKPEERMRQAVLYSVYASLDMQRELVARETKPAVGTIQMTAITPTARIDTREGRRLLEIRSGIVRPAGKYSGMRDNAFHTTIRADAFTHRIVECEYDVEDLQTHRLESRTIRSNYRYDRPQSVNAFNLSVPPATPVVIDNKPAGVTR